MNGTTEISRLSGTPAVGYFTETEMITVSGKENLPRGEQDFLIALNNLNTLYKGAQTTGDTQFSTRLENLMDLASVAILLYESAENGVTEINRALPCLLALYESGAFDQDPGTTNDQRSQVMNINLGAVIQNAGQYDPDESAFDALIAEVSVSTPGFDPSAYLSNRTLMRKAPSYKTPNRQATQAEINAAQKTLIDSAEYFMYSFIPDSKIDEYPDAVRNKRDYYTSVYADIKAAGCFSEQECLRIINDAIYSRYGCDGELFLFRVKKGEIPIVGGWIAVVGAILSALGVLASLLSSVFGTSEDKLNEDLKINAPSVTDGFAGIVSDTSGIVTSPSIIPDAGGSDDTLLDITTPTGTVAGSNYLGIILIGGLLMALILGDSGDKKKKKKK